ncbi:MAG: hypothetical protein MJ175_04615 [Clostridia bacterium]|nr:hypothetical protein [Clostridia bacterium]
MKTYMMWLTLAAMTMLLLPWLVFSYAGGELGFFLCLLLLFVINPVYAMQTGFYAGRDPGRLWSLPLVTVMLFFFGGQLFYGLETNDFLLYGAIYLGFAMLSMAASLIIAGMAKSRRKRVRNT